MVVTFDEDTQRRTQPTVFHTHRELPKDAK